MPVGADETGRGHSGRRKTQGTDAIAKAFRNPDSKANTMTRLQNESHSHIRGFNYQPSYASHGIEIWAEHFDLAAIRTELGHGKEHFPGINTIRLWLSHDAWLRRPTMVTERIQSVIALADDYDIQFIPTLFNAWHSWPAFGGVTTEMVGHWGGDARFDIAFRPYIEAIVTPHVDDSRVLLWDLCNEPKVNPVHTEHNALWIGWLRRVRAAIEALGDRGRITIGGCGPASSIALLEPLSDVISCHPYYAWNMFCKTADEFCSRLDDLATLANAAGKPMFASETGWGELDDRKRADTLAFELSALTQRGFGFVVHLLHHTLVADGHRPECGPISLAGYMACIEADGSMRRHHEVINAFI